MGNRRRQQLWLTLQVLTTRLQRGETGKKKKLSDVAEEVEPCILQFHQPEDRWVSAWGATQAICTESIVNGLSLINAVMYESCDCTSPHSCQAKRSNSNGHGGYFCSVACDETSTILLRNQINQRGGLCLWPVMDWQCAGGARLERVHSCCFTKHWSKDTM